MAVARDQQAAASPFAGAGEIRALCRAIDWSATSLGPVERWPLSLRIAVRVCLDAQSPMAVWAGPELLLVYNDGYPPVLGPSRHPWALGRPAREVWASIWDRLGPELDRVMHGESTAHVDERFLLPRGGREEESFFTYSLTPLQEEDGRIVGALNVFLETTDRVRSLGQREAALRESERRLRVLLENVSSGVALVDASGHFTEFNQRFLAMFGLSPDSTIHNVNSQDWSAWQVFDPGGRLLHVDEHPVRGAARSRQPVRNQLVGVRLPGGRETSWMLVSAAPLFDASGAVEHLICTYHDITELKAAQEALLAANARLKEEDRRKNQFMAVLSHELRNPLAPIKNSLYILARAAPGGDQATRARAVIERQVDQLARLVDDLLDVTRITRNKIQLQRRPLELSELVRRTLEDHRTLFEDAGVRLELADVQGPVFVHADGNRVAQIIGNLLSNAAKFTARGGRVTLSVAADPGAQQAVVRVADTGAGIAPEMLDRLFEPFTQADDTLDRARGGLGLGLALVKGLAELHGGTVTATSAGSGRGAEFTIRLPLDRPARDGRDRAGDGAGRGPRRRVLVVEDNEDAAESLRDLLELEDHEVVIARDGPEGLVQARAFRPDVVLCDIGLPGMSGYDVARALRADPELADTLLVAVTGYALPEDLQRATEAGFDHHLAKPPSLERLAELFVAHGAGGA